MATTIIGALGADTITGLAGADTLNQYSMICLVSKRSCKTGGPLPTRQNKHGLFIRPGAVQVRCTTSCCQETAVFLA